MIAFKEEGCLADNYKAGSPAQIVRSDCAQGRVMLIKYYKFIGLAYFMTFLSGMVYGQELPSPQDARAKELPLLQTSLEAAKKSLVDISSELLVLRETAQFPEHARVTVFLAADKLPRFQLESVELQLDGRVVASHRYTMHEKEAMQQGGLQRLYTGNLDVGLHTVKAIFKGSAPDTHEYSNSASYNFEKAENSKVFTLGIYDFLQDNSPEMTIREYR